MGLDIYITTTSRTFPLSAFRVCAKLKWLPPSVRRAEWYRYYSPSSPTSVGLEGTFFPLSPTGSTKYNCFYADQVITRALVHEPELKEPNLSYLAIPISKNQQR